MITQIKQSIDTAFRHLGDRVVNGIFKHKTGEEFNPSTGMMETTYSEESVKVVIQDYSLTEIGNSGGAITTGDKKVLLPTNQTDYVPIAGEDKLIINGDTHTINSVQKKLSSMYVLKI